ncbi:family 43 glycosylhydrolase [Lactonifactor sp. BIOML-A3]|uniref:family 43 glycosylhydrolase n=1 Tax=unclassified Lactonifactor TaxID=2636670 RepID=UPI0012AFB276|nr:MULTISPECIES: family 43 glycosylhydrolase [unclassified Lactonifactor]MSA00220.1 family 43 glycosylhydrolase [Lactonifactor sp. BIOML-A5]MSA06847.1 family 43 glycosylhydrolase [Lactonifactor sp. BIOML-A4]MSA11065.1 family 43 glycosylhydrolase [Lactonifactor sp. BIOML-A3]MSA16079.1 family 43 glycosylhydrolase [Lactonifactor sp. BIOML-A2]MSA36683.1 family 43 glycosylhydrolase [Lactonifactor sp. BIOML-A1]
MNRSKRKRGFAGLLATTLTLSMVLSTGTAVFAAPPEVPEGYTRYEAEDGVTYGIEPGKEFERGNDYSGGMAVANLDKMRSGFDALDFEFKNTSHVEITVPREENGVVEVVVGYVCSGGDRPANDIAVKSNDGTPKRVEILGKKRASVKVDMQAGDNVVYVSTTLGDKADNGWVNIDYIDVNDVTEPGTVEPEEVEIIQPNNPIIKSMYTADPSAHVWDDGRIYIYASHDTDPARGCDLMDRYHVFSSDNMVDWIDEGEILSSDDVEWGRPEGGFMWAPDAAYKDGTYYFYYPHPSESKWNDSWKVGIATSKFPDKEFTDIGYIEGMGGDAMIDPCVFMDDDGKAYIYLGGGGKCVGAELNDDMISIKSEPVPMEGLDDFHEGTWIFKRNGIYYLTYPDNHGGNGNRMKYATSDSPLGPWEYQDVFLDSTGCDTSHGSVVEYKGEWYLFYHNKAISGTGNLRSVCVDKLEFDENGKILMVEQTLDSVEPVGPRVEPSEDMVTYQADEAELEGDAALLANDKASAGNVVTNLHKSGSAVVFNNVDGGEVGGRATIGINFSTPDKGKLKLIVNGVDYSYVNTLATGGKSFFTGHSEFTVNDMTPGATNTVRLEGGNSRVFLENITVTPFNDADDETPSVTGITLSGDYKTAYQMGDSFDKTGMVVTADFSDGRSQKVMGYKVSGFDSSVRGLQTVTISFEGAEAQFQVRIIAPPEWVQSGDRWWYDNGDDTWPQDCWKQIDGKWYHFDTNGYRQTGWLQDGKNRYFLKNDGTMATGWANDRGSWYYLREDGTMMTGWLKDRSCWYYLNGDGSMATGWVMAGGAWYYCNGSGIMQTGWLKESGTWYYLKDSGAMATGWLLDGTTWYYLNANGSMATGWIKIGNTWYYCNGSGAMQTGWIKSGTTWYYLKNSGAMATGWLLDGTTWYYLKSSGAMVTGWVKDGSTWYYCSGSGAMQTGWVYTGGNYYYLYDNGAMAANTWIGKYYVNGSGVWTKTR